MYIVHCAST